MDDQFKNLLSEIAGYNPTDLKREKGDFQFTDVSKEIEKILSFIKDFSTNEDFYHELPDNEQQNLKNRLTTISSIFQQINNFKPQDIPNPQDARNSLAEQTRAAYREIYPNIEQLDLFNLKTTGAQAKLSNITSEARKALNEVKETTKQINNILDTAQKTTAQVPIYEYLGIFHKAHIKYRNISIVWLCATVISTSGLLWFLYLVSQDISRTIVKLNSFQAVTGLLIEKLFFIAIAIYILQQMVRNYMANMHQAVVNEQRENSLKVFDAMVESVKSPETRDQVLSYLSKSIFELGDTGFFPGKEVGKEGPDFIQVFKDSIGKG